MASKNIDNTYNLTFQVYTNVGYKTINIVNLTVNKKGLIFDYLNTVYTYSSTFSNYATFSYIYENIDPSTISLIYDSEFFEYDSTLNSYRIKKSGKTTVTLKTSDNSYVINKDISAVIISLPKSLPSSLESAPQDSNSVMPVLFNAGGAS